MILILVNFYFDKKDNNSIIVIHISGTYANKVFLSPLYSSKESNFGVHWYQIQELEQPVETMTRVTNLDTRNIPGQTRFEFYRTSTPGYQCLAKDNF